MPNEWSLPTYTTNANPLLAEWERELLEQNYIHSQAQARTGDTFDADLQALIDARLSTDRLREERAPQPAPTASPLDLPLTGYEAFKTLRVGARFFAQGPSVESIRWWRVRTKISEDLYTTEGETTRRRASGWRPSVKLIRTT